MPSHVDVLVFDSERIPHTLKLLHVCLTQFVVRHVHQLHQLLPVPQIGLDSLEFIIGVGRVTDEVFILLLFAAHVAHSDLNLLQCEKLLFNQVVNDSLDCLLINVEALVCLELSPDLFAQVYEWNTPFLVHNVETEKVSFKVLGGQTPPSPQQLL